MTNKIPVFKTPAMPSQLSWAAQRCALVNMTLWSLVMIYGFAVFGLSPLLGISGFLLGHIALSIATRREPHLDGVLAGIFSRLRHPAKVAVVFSEDGKTLLSGRKTVSALIRIERTAPITAESVNAFSACLAQVAADCPVTLRLITSTFPQQSLSVVMLSTTKGQGQLDQAASLLYQNLPGYRLTRMDQQPARRFLAKCLNPAFALNAPDAVLPTPGQKGNILIFHSPDKTLYAAVLTPRDVSFVSQEAFLGTILATYSDLVVIQAVNPMRATKAAFIIAQHQQLSQSARFDHRASQEFMQALDIIEEQKNSLCQYTLALIVFAPSLEAVHDRVAKIQRHAATHTVNLVQENGAALATWKLLLADHTSWPRPYKIFDQHVAPHLAAAISEA
jgi:CagE, TrbE, VirB family, component of type IV transporter system